MSWNDLPVNSYYKTSLFPEKQPKNRIIFTNARACFHLQNETNFLLFKNSNSLL
jgi:hypothetical protein